MNRQSERRSMSRWLLALMSAIGGGACGSAAPINLALYEGRWEYTTGTRRSSCVGVGSDETLSGEIEITKNSDGTLAFTGDGCTVTYGSSGASPQVIASRSSCGAAVGGLSLGYRIVSGDISTGDGKTLQLREKGEFNALIISCASDTTATLRRIDGGPFGLDGGTK